jgi:hypothetical protein
VALAKGFTITEAEVSLSGYCARCRPGRK